MRDDPMVTDLVTRAQYGDQQAWNTLVERYAPLMWSICRRYRLSSADTDDVSQTVWLRLVAHLDQIRNPSALAGWIATTTSRECGQARGAARPFPPPPGWKPTPATFPTGPSQPKRCYWRPNGARRCARR